MVTASYYYCQTLTGELGMTEDDPISKFQTFLSNEHGFVDLKTAFQMQQP